MGLFDKNPNEAAYVGGKKHWTDVIKNSGPGELLIWRQPEEDFNTNSTLVVMPGEQAIFINGGVIEQTFENGTYKLSTDNYPFISRLRNAFSGGISTFNCVVYFVRTAHSMEVTWGTSKKFGVRDKVYGIQTDIGAYGAYKVSVGNPGIFLTKMIGNNVMFETQEGLDNYFFNEFQGKIVSTLSREIQAYPGELLGLEAEIDNLCQAIRPKIDEILRDYGLKCESFSIAGIDIDNAYRQQIESARAGAVASQFDKVARQNMVAADYAGRGIGLAEEAQYLGPNFAGIKSAEILTNIANNPGAGGMASAAQGVGMGMMAGGMMGTLVTNMASMGMPQQQMTGMGMNQGMQQMTLDPNARFQQQGAPQQAAQPQAEPQPQAQAPQTDIVAQMKQFKDLLDMGLITQEEYEMKRKQLLGL